MKNKRIYLYLWILALVLLAGCGGKKETVHESNGLAITDYQLKTENNKCTVTYTIKNNSDQTLVFEGIGIREMDRNDQMTDSYESYTKSYQESEIGPGETVELSLEFDLSTDVDHVRSEYCIYKESLKGDYLKEEFDNAIEISLRK